MIKTIFVDFDGVLTIDSSGSYTTCANIQNYIPEVPFEHILQCYRVHQPKLLLGQVTHVTVLNDFCACVGRNISMEMFYEAFRNTPANVKMMELCKKLKRKYKLGIITDNSKERFDILKQEMGLAEIFDIIIVSGETGIRKDSDKTFVQAVELAKCHADECVFIDNNESNLIVPKKFGWETIFHDDKKNDVEFLIKMLENLGVSMN